MSWIHETTVCSTLVGFPFKNLNYIHEFFTPGHCIAVHYSISFRSCFGSLFSTFSLIYLCLSFQYLSHLNISCCTHLWLLFFLSAPLWLNWNSSPSICKSLFSFQSHWEVSTFKCFVTSYRWLAMGKPGVWNPCSLAVEWNFTSVYFQDLGEVPQCWSAVPESV